MANNENEIVDFATTNWTERANCFVSCGAGVPSATDQSYLTFNYCVPGDASRDYMLFYKLMNILTHSTVHVIRDKKLARCTVEDKGVGTCETQDSVITYTSLSLTGDNIITPVVCKVKRVKIDAVTSTTRLGETARCTIVSTCDEIQSDYASKEFDAFAEACERRRRADQILGKISEISDKLTEKKRPALDSAIESVCESTSTDSENDETDEEIFEREKLLPIIRTKEKMIDATAPTVKQQPVYISEIKKKEKEKIEPLEKIDSRPKLDKDVPVVRDNAVVGSLRRDFPQETKKRDLSRKISKPFIKSKKLAPEERSTSIVKIQSAEQRRVTTDKKIATFLSSPEMIRNFFALSGRSPRKVCSRDRCKLSKILQATRFCDDATPSNICFEKSKYLDAIPSFCSRKTARIATSSHVCCSPLRDSCARYQSGLRLPIDANASFGNCDVNNYANRRTTFGNLQPRCICSTKCYYLRSSDMNNVRMGGHHHHHHHHHHQQHQSWPAWSNARLHGRDQLYCWTRGNLYFTHPWTFGHLLRFN